MDTNALFKIGYGLYLVTSNDGANDNGCIVNTFFQLTSNPVRVLLGINKNNYSCKTIADTGIFNACILSEEADYPLYERFGFQSGKDINKFEGFADVTRTASGLLVPNKGVNAVIQCKVQSTMDFDTHLLFAADVTDAEIINESPTATYEYYMSTVKPKPKKTGIKGWRCKICGFVYEGEELPADYECPLCKHGPEDFEPIE